MTRHERMIIVITLPAVAVFGLLLLTGCEGSKAKKEVTRTVEQAVGAETARKGRQIEQDLNRSMRQEMERANREIETGTAGNEPSGPEESSGTPPK